jgi:hypothetical protein
MMWSYANEPQMRMRILSLLQSRARRRTEARSRQPVAQGTSASATRCSTIPDRYSATAFLRRASTRTASVTKEIGSDPDDDERGLEVVVQAEERVQVGEAEQREGARHQQEVILTLFTLPLLDSGQA